MCDSKFFGPWWMLVGLVLWGQTPSGVGAERPHKKGHRAAQRAPAAPEKELRSLRQEIDRLRKAVRQAKNGLADRSESRGFTADPQFEPADVLIPRNGWIPDRTPIDPQLAPRLEHLHQAIAHLHAAGLPRLARHVQGEADRLVHERIGMRLRENRAERVADVEMPPSAENRSLTGLRDQIAELRALLREVIAAREARPIRPRQSVPRLPHDAIPSEGHAGDQARAETSAAESRQEEEADAPYQGEEKMENEGDQEDADEGDDDDGDGDDGDGDDGDGDDGDGDDGDGDDGDGDDGDGDDGDGDDGDGDDGDEDDGDEDDGDEDDGDEDDGDEDDGDEDDGDEDDGDEDDGDENDGDENDGDENDGDENDGDEDDGDEDDGDEDDGDGDDGDGDDGDGDGDKGEDR